MRALRACWQDWNDYSEDLLECQGPGPVYSECVGLLDAEEVGQEWSSTTERGSVEGVFGGLKWEIVFYTFLLLRRLQNKIGSRDKSNGQTASPSLEALREQLQYWKTLRQDLERVRLLIELVR